MLDTSTWKEFRIEKIFDIINGKGITTTEIEENPGELVAVQSSESQNGCMGYINKGYCIDMNYKMTDKPCLTVARTGSVAFVSYQPNGCVVGDSAKILLLKDRDKISNGVMLFLKTILTLLRERYNFARKVTEDIYGTDIIKLPVENTGGKAVIDENYKYSDDGYVPDYQFMEDFIKSLNGDVSSIPDYFLDEGYDKVCWYLDNIDVEKFESEYAGKRIEKNIKLSDRLFKTFKIEILFERGNIYKSVSYSNEQVTDSVDNDYLCYVTRSDNNNGIMRYVVNDTETFEKGNCITIGDTTATCFYQEHDFVNGDHIIVMRADWLNKYVGQFIVTLLNFEKFRYPPFGRAFLMNCVKDTELQLPIKHNDDGTPFIDETKKYSVDGYVPDWQFMEDYIKSLPFSCKL